MKPEETMDFHLEKKVKELLHEGKKVEAITAVQNQLKIGLKNSKDLVDRLEKSQNASHSVLD